MRDPFGSYLRLISRYEVLTRKQELILGNKVQNMVKIETHKKIFNCVLIKGLSEKELDKIKQEGIDAKKRLIKHNLKLVVSVARNYLNRGLTIDDLVQEGTSGLNRAAEKFNPYRGFKFSTYSTYWIKQAITRSIARNVRTIRLPSHIYEQLNKLKKATRILSQRNGRMPSVYETARFTGLTVEKIRSLHKYSKTVKSLSSTIKDGDSVIELIDFVQDDEAETSEQMLSRTLLCDFVNDTIDDVLKNERDREIIRHKYGLNGYEILTSRDLSYIYGVTTERIRQIERECMNKIKDDIADLIKYKTGKDLNIDLDLIKDFF